MLKTDIELLKEIYNETIPDFDFLFAGFPCQPFSKGGYRKGFEDSRGTLFFEVARIIFINRLPCLKLIKYPHLKAICYIVKAFAMF
jgi:site-specific DNA-cytosine methylase